MHGNISEQQDHGSDHRPSIRVTSDSKDNMLQEVAEVEENQFIDTVAEPGLLFQMTFVHSFIPCFDTAVAQQPQDTNCTDEIQSQAQSTDHEQKEQEKEEEEDPTITLIPCFPPIKAAPPDFREAKEGGAIGWVKYIFSMILFVLSFPFLVVFTWTIPNCSINRKWYVVAASFLMSIFWIAAVSFAMVTLVTKLGCLLDIGQFTMGLVIVAIGTSIPVSNCVRSLTVCMIVELLF